MKTLSIRQPWAWLIVNGYKDIGNRTWRTKFRGTFGVHAGYTKPDIKEWRVWQNKFHEMGIQLPEMNAVDFG